jgi:hypothetical protein
MYVNVRNAQINLNEHIQIQHSLNILLYIFVTESRPDEGEETNWTLYTAQEAHWTQ